MFDDLLLEKNPDSPVFRKVESALLSIVLFYLHEVSYLIPKLNEFI